MECVQQCVSGTMVTDSVTGEVWNSGEEWNAWNIAAMGISADGDLSQYRGGGGVLLLGRMVTNYLVG